MLLPWVIGLFVVAAGQWAWFRWGDSPVDERSRRRATAITVLIGVLAVGISLGTMIVLVLIGDSGARAVWGPIMG